MTGPRIALGLRGASAASLVTAGRLAEASNVDLIVVGDVSRGAANSDDTYVLTAATAVATTTTDLRVALALDLRGSAPLLRVAEDLGVLDVASGGRTELLLSPGTDPAAVDAVLGAWLAWPLPDGSSVPVTPSPVQPVIPTWFVDGGVGTARHGGSGVVFTDWPGGIPDVAALQEIRRVRDEAGAATVVIDAGAVPETELPGVIRALGTVVGPCLRCPADEVAILALDSTDYLLHRTDLHEPPLPRGQSGSTSPSRDAARGRSGSTLPVEGQ